MIINKLKIIMKVRFALHDYVNNGRTLFLHFYNNHKYNNNIGAFKGTVKKNERGYRRKPERYLSDIYLMFLTREKTVSKLYQNGHVRFCIKVVAQIVFNIMQPI